MSRTTPKVHIQSTHTLEPLVIVHRGQNDRRLKKQHRFQAVSVRTSVSYFNFGFYYVSLFLFKSKAGVYQGPAGQKNRNKCSWVK